MIAMKSTEHENIPNVTLANLHTSVMNTLGQSKLEDLSLQTTLEEIFHAKTQDVIELHLALIQHSDTDQASKKRVSYDKNEKFQ